ncbi:MAG: 1-deoxy-D-xylulose-5-phosphate reductoisomerase [Planctomycetota bacterium]|nr:MAG: 1-deoxy-D-xylulose-5-phosphate reductoisomerase [Planctomycetota bacterium]
MPPISPQPTRAASPADARVRRVVVLGCAGSIGTQTLDAIRHINGLHDRGRFPHRFEVVGLATGRNVEAMIGQARSLGVTRCAIAEGSYKVEGIDLDSGPGSAERLVRETECDLVVGAIVGVAGLPGVLAGLERGVDIALANKETLVAAGSVVIPLARRTGARILPIDSEHAGVWQCLMHAAGPDYAPPHEAPQSVHRVTLTASGGAFRGRDPADLTDATPDEALVHPNWDMGAKVTVDSATLVNKALELIEAHWLFGLEADRLDAVIHPGSVVHALVSMKDGSVIAQMGTPDMRTPIMRSLTFPGVSPEPLAPLDLIGAGPLEFRPIEGSWRRAIDLGFRAIRAGGDAGAVFNAANEVAVRAFLDRRIPFGRILDIVESVCDALSPAPAEELGSILEADARARAHADSLVGSP